MSNYEGFSPPAFIVANYFKLRHSTFFQMHRSCIANRRRMAKQLHGICSFPHFPFHSVFSANHQEITIVAVPREISRSCCSGEENSAFHSVQDLYDVRYIHCHDRNGEEDRESNKNRIVHDSFAEWKMSPTITQYPFNLFPAAAFDNVC
jgi:hypothetical protein